MSDKTLINLTKGFLLLLIIPFVINCDDSFSQLTNTYVSVLAINVRAESSSLEENETEILCAEISPSDATETSVTWSSSDVTVASVDSDGLVTALSSGIVNITATTCDGSGISGMAELTVSESTLYYTITFDSGEGSSVDSQNVKEGDYITEPNDPEKEGYTFEGWYIDETYYTSWDFDSDTVSENMTLYAEWTEIFDDEDKPSTQLLSYESDSQTYKLLEPWNYNKAYNSEREYPLVIGLHGSTDYTNVYFMPTIVGDEEEMQDYPCFYLAPNNSSYGWDDEAEWVRDLIEELIDTYRIDTNRIYILGFSMGGSGSYYFTEDLYDEKGLTVAGIVRCAGMSNYDLPDAIASRISVWYNYGEADSDTIISTATSAYDFMKDLSYYEGAEETIEEDAGEYGGYQTNNTFLSLEDIDFMRLTSYEEMGHEYTPVFENPEVLSWLFSQSLEDR
jgi:uncharacterized repeat protein (TIGR02543 family)